MGIGKLGGPALGGLLGSISLALPFFVTAGLIFLSGLAVYFLLPESLAPEKRTKQVTLRSFNTFSHFKDIFSLKEVKSLLILSILFYAGLGIFQFNFIIFLKDIYKWSPAFIGTILTLVGVCDITTRAVGERKSITFNTTKQLSTVATMRLFRMGWGCRNIDNKVPAANIQTPGTVQTDDILLTSRRCQNIA